MTAQSSMALNERLTFLKMVPATGLEPVLTYVNKILSLACLPVPPCGHLGMYYSKKFEGSNNMLLKLYVICF
jgi:hypothetical protein